jgi:hypothetical protein
VRCFPLTGRQAEGTSGRLGSVNDRRALLTAAVGFLQLPPQTSALRALRAWLDSWTGIGHIVTGMERHGFRAVVEQVRQRRRCPVSLAMPQAPRRDTPTDHWLTGTIRGRSAPRPAAIIHELPRSKRPRPKSSMSLVPPG